MFWRNFVSYTLAIAAFAGVCVQQGMAIRCWNCNSKYNPGCADPFNNSTMGYPTDCLPTFTLPNIQAVTQCRKIVHMENGIRTFIRGCKADDHLNLYQAEYHVCNYDACNGAPGPFTVFVNIAAPMAVLLMRVTNII